MRHLALRIVGGAAVGVSVLILNVGVSAAGTIMLTYDCGVMNTACTGESVACPQDILPGFPNSVVGSVYTNVFNGGYRAGGNVQWDFTFDASPFTTVDFMVLRVDVVGLYEGYAGNIDPDAGQIGNYLAIDGVPFAPFLDNTDHLDSHALTIPVLSAGPHLFSVWAYDDPRAKYEGWGGVDFARLTVWGESAPVPDPGSSLLLLGIGLVGLRACRKRLG